MNEETSAPAEVVESTEQQQGSEGVSESSAEVLQDAVQEAVANGATKQEIQNLKKSFELKVNGKTFKKEFDLSNDAEMQKEFQMAAAGREAMQMKAEYEKALRTLVDQLKNDPLALAEELGLNADDIAATRLQRKIEEAKKSPEQQKQEKLEREIEEYRRREQEREAQLLEAQNHKILQEAQEQIDTEIDTALSGYKSLPSNSPMVYDLIAKNMVWVMDNFEQFGYAKPEDVRVEDVLPTVEQQLKGTVNKLLEDIPEEFLDAWIGSKTIDKQRKKRLAGAKNVSNINNIKKTTQEKEEKKEDSPKIKLSDWMREGF